jgi:hypothetical protein
MGGDERGNYSEVEAGVPSERVPDFSSLLGSLETLAGQPRTLFFGVAYLVSIRGWFDHAERGSRAGVQGRCRRADGGSNKAESAGREGRRARSARKAFQSAGRRKGNIAVDTSPDELGARIWSFDLQIPLLGEVEGDAAFVLIFDAGLCKPKDYLVHGVGHVQLLLLDESHLLQLRDTPIEELEGCVRLAVGIGAPHGKGVEFRDGSGVLIAFRN